MNLAKFGLDIRAIDINGNVVSGYAARNAVRYEIYNVFTGAALPVGQAVIGNLETTADTADAPTIAAGAAAGTSPTLTITGTNRRGVANITTGTSAATGVLATITLGRALVANPIPMICPGNAATGAVVAKLWAVGASTTTFTINVVTAALADSTAYVINWSV